MAVWDIKERNNIVRANDIRGNVGLFAAGNNGSLITTIEDINLTTAGNATTFGNLISARGAPAGMGSAIRGFFSGGETPSANVDVIEYIAFSTGGNTSDFGNLLGATRGQGTASNNTRGIMAGGTPRNDVVEFITMASIGNAIDFGNLTAAGVMLNGGLADTTRACFAGVNQNPGTNYNTYIDFFTISATGNATDFGDLTVARYNCAGVSSSTRGVWQGGRKSPGANSNDVDYITISSTGNAADFGDLTVARYSGGGASNSVRGTMAGGASPAQNTIDFIQIATTANSTDFGDLGSVREGGTGCANGHGGIDLSTPGSQRPQVTALNRPGQTLGLFGGGNDGPAYLKSCEVVQVETLGRSSSFGDLTLAVNNSFSMSGNRTRGIRHSGYVGGSSPYTTNTMDYTEFASRGNFADFGDATAAGYGASRGPSTNDTRSFSMGFYNASGNLTTVDYWAPATLGNAADFGDLSVGSLKAAGMANTTRVIRYGSYSVNTIDYHAIASLGDFSDFGDAVAALGAGEAVSSPVRGVRVGAQSASNTMEYVTMASTGNGTDFGDLTVGRSDMGAASSHTRGVIFAGVGSSNAIVNTIDYITIASAGNATDFGDASFARGSLAGMGNGHGGLA
tara:strand:- start:73 stop:1944 length:1872 start_codon:yes stop_codon:yes gene_type:complete